MPTPNLTAALRRLAPDDTPDGELLARYVREQDEAAFAVLVSRHGGMVRTVCRRVLRNDADADDAVQATFLVLVRKASAVRDRNGLANWLFGVAYNVALKARQMRTRRKVKESGVESRPPEAVTADFAELLHAELAKLPAAARGVIVLCDLEQRTIADAARELGVPAGTVASRLARGREQLAKRLRRYGLSVSGGLVATLFGEAATAAVTFDPATLEPHIHTLANEVTRTMFTTTRIARHAVLLGLLVTLGGGILVLRNEAKEPDLRVARRNAPVPKVKQPDPKEVLVEALDLARMKVQGVDNRTTSTFAIAEELARCGDKEAAIKAFDMGLFDGPGNWVSRVGMMARAGLVDEAFERLNRGQPNEAEKAERRRLMVMWLRTTEDLKSITKLADESAGDDRDEVLAILARVQARLGKLTEAGKTIDEIQSDGPRLRAVCPLAVEYHRSKDAQRSARFLEDAVAITDRMIKRDGVDKCNPEVQELAWAQAFTGSPEVAKRTVEKLTSPELVKRSLAEVAAAQIEARDLKGALATTESTESNYHFGAVWAKVVDRHATKGEWERAAEIANSIRCDFWRVRSYQMIAVANSKAGKHDSAAQALAKADELMGPMGTNISDSEPGIVGLRKKAWLLQFRTQAEMGLADKALTAARAIDAPEDKVYALIEIARGLRAPLPNEESGGWIRWR